MPKRNEAIEMLRVLMMFGICLEHAIWQCGYVPKYHVTTNFCVCGFVFISGFWGIRFKWNKVLRLVGLGAFCAFVACGTAALTGGGIVAHLSACSADGGFCGHMLS